MTSDHMRWGILGAARIAHTSLAPAIAQATGAELVALATRTPERADPFRPFAAKLTVHASYEALLDDPSVDAVYIPLPNHLHVEWSERAARAGKHVLCEKPIALLADQIDQLIATRDATNRLIAEGFMVAHHPQWALVRAILQRGDIGPLVHVEGVFTYNNTDLTNIRHNPAMGGGALRDIGVYPCICTRMVTGAEPTLLRADLQMQGGVDVFARVWAEFPGFTMSFYCAMRAARRQHMVFHGRDGWITLTAPFNANAYGACDVLWQGADGIELRQGFHNVNQYARMIEAFGSTVHDGTPFACPLEMSRGNQAMIDAIFAAAEG